MAMVDNHFLVSTTEQLLAGVPLTLELTLLSVVLGAVLAFILALMRISGHAWLDLPARCYAFVFRGRRCWCSYSSSITAWRNSRLFATASCGPSCASHPGARSWP